MEKEILFLSESAKAIDLNSPPNAMQIFSRQLFGICWVWEPFGGSLQWRHNNNQLMSEKKAS